MKQLDLNSLSVFITLYHAGSTQKAALKLNRSQSYVSKVLAKLTEDLGEPLFVRTSAGLEPTSYANNNYGIFGY
ncbi:LysR family transcriptional regulator [Colwellia sp.]|uniref:helix-turn-helix domain-containing protein n=1 Tax=Colwellia sp. TaxID=56799 RepID=UPI0025BD843C|nr:LysR family transcriptional regulator [Colwellia sp.]